MNNRKTTAYHIAFSAIISAIVVLLMFASIIPAMVYIVPAVAGLLIWTISDELGLKWACAAFVACSLLCMFIIPNVEAVAFFIAFFGYYPMVCEKLSRLKTKLIAYLIKLTIFNVAIVSVFNLLTMTLGAEEMLDGLDFFMGYGIYILWVIANLMFVIYDRAVGILMLFYKRIILPRIKRFIK